jgi:hypothetical protein
MTEAPQAAPSTGTRMPGTGAAAAVLGFVEAGLGLAACSYVLVLLASFGAAGTERGTAAVVVVGTVALSALLAVGGVFLVRGTGRRLLVGASVAEVVVVLGVGVWGLVDSSSTYDLTGGYGAPASSGPALEVALLTLVMVGLALPVVRLALLAQPAVGTWVRSRPGAPPVWSEQAQQWVGAPRRGVGTVLAVLAPVVLLLAATLVVLTSADGPVPPGFADGGVDGVYGTDSPYSDLYAGGTPVEPPAEGDPFYEARYDDAAQDCFDGDLGACDDLYYDAEVGSLYEWLGSTCGGREPFETYGLCD